MMPRSNLSARILITDMCGVLVLVACCAAAWMISIHPALQRTHQVEHLRTEILVAATQVRELEQRTTRAQHDLANASAELEHASVRLVSIDARNARLAELTTLASGLGLAVDELSPAEPAKGELFERVAIEIKGRGTYPALARFVHTLHADYPDTEVSSFRISRSGGDAVYSLRLVWNATPSQRIRSANP